MPDVTHAQAGHGGVLGQSCVAGQIVLWGRHQAPDPVHAHSIYVLVGLEAVRLIDTCGRPNHLEDRHARPYLGDRRLLRFEHDLVETPLHIGETA